MCWGWWELNPRRPSQNVTGRRFRLNHSAKGAVLYIKPVFIYEIYGSHFADVLLHPLEQAEVVLEWSFME